MAGTKSEALAALVGQELTSLEFVMDYVQLHFDRQHLSIISPPVLVAEGCQHGWESRELCQLLRECIRRRVVSTSVREGDRLTLCFDNGYELSVSLRPQDYVAPEAVEYTPDDLKGEMWIW